MEFVERAAALELGPWTQPLIIRAQALAVCYVDSAMRRPNLARLIADS
jgi:hypothetical protein